jgi:hypothetical protein
VFKLIGAVFKYTSLVLVVLVLSHIIQIQGVTVSQHVLNTMNFVTGYSPKSQADRITASFTKTMEKHISDLNKIDAEVTTDDQKALNHVIENSEKRGH